MCAVSQGKTPGQERRTLKATITDRAGDEKGKGQESEPSNNGHIPCLYTSKMGRTNTI
jgi:hypothetical protein